MFKAEQNMNSYFDKDRHVPVEAANLCYLFEIADTTVNR